MRQHPIDRLLGYATSTELPNNQQVAIALARLRLHKYVNAIGVALLLWILLACWTWSLHWRPWLTVLAIFVELNVAIAFTDAKAIPAFVMLGQLWKDQQQRGLQAPEHQLAYDLIVDGVSTTTAYLGWLVWVLLAVVAVWAWTNLGWAWTAGLVTAAFITFVSVAPLQAQRLLDVTRFAREREVEPTDPLPAAKAEEFIVGSTRPLHSNHLQHLKTARPLRKPYRSLSFIAVHYRWFTFLSMIATVTLLSKMELTAFARSLLFSDVLAIGTLVSLIVLLQRHLLLWWRGIRAWPYRTLVLRRFGHYTDLVSQMILGTVGCYGTVSLLNQTTLDRSPLEEFQWTNVQSPTTIAQMFLPPHLLGRVEILVEGTEWKDCVVDQLLQADCAIVDVTEISDSLEWELREVAAALPPERWILLAKSGDFESFDRWVAKRPDGGFPKMLPGTPVRIAYRVDPLSRGLLRLRLMAAVLLMDKRE